MNFLKLTVFIFAVRAAHSVEQKYEGKGQSHSYIDPLKAQGISPHIYQASSGALYIPQLFHTHPVAEVSNVISTPYPLVVSTPKTVLVPKYNVGAKSIGLISTVAPLAANDPNSVYDEKAYSLYTVSKSVPTSTGKYVTLTKSLPHQHELEGSEKQYKYGYRVSNAHSGAEFGHSEVHDGQTAKGYYHVLLPDGRLQNVKYWAGSSGFHAVISYDH